MITLTTLLSRVIIVALMVIFLSRAFNADSGIKALLLVLFFCVLGYAFSNANLITETKYSMSSDSLKDSYKIVLISDIHFGGGQFKNIQLSELKRLKEKDIDILILAGDITEEMTTEKDAARLFKALGDIETTYGKYFIFGNHDMAVNQRVHRFSEETLIDMLESNGIQVLRDSSVLINDDIKLVGRDNKMTGNRKQLNELLDREDTHYTIVVDHIPSDEEARKQPVDLFLSGHTHAGQVFLLGKYLECTSNDLLYGRCDFDNTENTQIVTSGAGVGAIPYRTSHSCEYVFIDLQPKGDKEF